MLEYGRIDISDGIDINKTNASKECDICHYWYFLDKNCRKNLEICTISLVWLTWLNEKYNEF